MPIILSALHTLVTAEVTPSLTRWKTKPVKTGRTWKRYSRFTAKMITRDLVANHYT